MHYDFVTPFEFEGKQYTGLDFDLDKLKGSDIAAVKKQYAGAGNFAAIPTADSEFCAMILARVTKQPLEFFQELPAKDYCALTQRVSNFFLG
jgi:hypothetical protein